MPNEDNKRWRLIRAERDGNHAVVFDECTPTRAWEKHSIECKEEAREEFYEAMEDLVPDLVKIQGWPATYQNGIELRAVHYRLSDTGYLTSLVFEASRISEEWPEWKFRSVSMPITLVHRRTGLVEKLSTLQACALRYANGLRIQQTLFEAQDDDAARRVVDAAMDLIEEASSEESDENEEGNTRLTVSSGGRSVSLTDTQLEQATKS